MGEWENCYYYYYFLCKTKQNKNKPLKKPKEDPKENGRGEIILWHYRIKPTPLGILNNSLPQDWFPEHSF